MGAGRPKIELTDAQKNEARVLAGVGTPHSIIAKCLGISENILRRECGDELAEAKQVCNGQVAMTLFRMATNGRNLAATIFWLKTQARWRETIDVNMTQTADLSKLTTEQLAMLESILPNDSEPQ